MMKNLSKSNGIYVIFYFCLFNYLSAQVFVDEASEYGLADSRREYAAVWIDFDNDGDLDLFVTADHDNFAALYRNDGSSFTDIAESVDISYGHPTSGILLSAGDFDNDGFIDLSFNASSVNSPYNLFKYMPQTENFTGFGRYGSYGMFGDYDNDGYLDIYCPNPSNNNYLFRYDKSLGFIKMEGALGADDNRNSQKSLWGDYDNDGDLDIYVINGQYERNTLYRNDININGQFMDVTEITGVGGADYSNGACWGDFDNDGDLDLYVANSGYDILYRNDFSTLGRFTDITTDVILNRAEYSRHCSWVDYDNDGYLDLYVVTVEEIPNRLYRNTTFNDSGFVETGEMADTQLGSGGSWADFDKDGDLDFYLTGGNPENEMINRLYVNNSSSNGNNWLNIELNGRMSNRSAIGSVVRIITNGNKQMRYVESSSGNSSQNSLPLEFGLGSTSIIDTLKVKWSYGGEQFFTDVDVNQFLTIREPFIHANFMGDTLVGFSPFNVNFTDQSETDSLNDIISWKWDFNDDGIVDSYEQNPSWIFDTAGIYSIKLVVSNGVYGDSLIKENYIAVDQEKPIIISIKDVENDQGGWVKMTFFKSSFDTDSLKVAKAASPELYTVELGDGTDWTAAATTVAYGKSVYSILVPTTMDSTQESNGLIDFRVIAGMNEGNYVSNIMQGYSVDNLAPSIPQSLSGK